MKSIQIVLFLFNSTKKAKLEWLTISISSLSLTFIINYYFAGGCELPHGLT